MSLSDCPCPPSVPGHWHAQVECNRPLQHTIAFLSRCRGPRSQHGDEGSDVKRHWKTSTTEMSVYFTDSVTRYTLRIHFIRGMHHAIVCMTYPHRSVKDVLCNSTCTASRISWSPTSRHCASSDAVRYSIQLVPSDVYPVARKPMPMQVCACIRM
jgi:hypothetical protein